MTTIASATAPSTSKAEAHAHSTATVPDLFSLKDRVVVITGGARGIGLTLAFAVVEAGGLVAVIDAAPSPHEQFEVLTEKAGAGRAGYYQ
jgi:sorbose reductase